MKKEKDKESFYDYDKIFLKLMASLNECETQEHVLEFINMHVVAFKEAPKELVEYLNTSINNKLTSIEKRENISLTKLRTIANSYR